MLILSFGVGWNGSIIIIMTETLENVATNTGFLRA